MAQVLLMRGLSTDDEDRYSTAFASAGYIPLSVPVLETVPTNLSSLQEIVRAGPASEDYDGVIMTSARSCEAWKNAVSVLMEQSSLNISTGGSGLSSFMPSNSSMTQWLQQNGPRFHST